MCGICGEAGSRQFIEPNEKVVLHMADTIIHRGPDDAGHFCVTSRGWAVNLAMRRLAIIDREGGKQPMHCGKVDLIANGEVYNHQRLRGILEGMGIHCHTHCDTEVVGRMWDWHGPACLREFDGMFAVALWSRINQMLYLVRDRLGKKPLYYHWDEGKNLLVFASEIKALLVHPHVRKDLNPEAIYHYLSLQYCPEPLTAFQGIRCVPPGHYLAYRPAEGKLEIVKYWELKPWKAVSRTSGEVTVADVRKTVREAVLSRLESEVPLGVYLSGGIDSAIVTAVAREACKELHTFSMGFREAAYNELPAARQTAKYFDTIHHEEMTELPTLPEMAQRVVDTYDQPYGDCSAIPTLLLCAASKKYITVALTGDGGDEAFGGYPRYWLSQPEHGIVGYMNLMAPIAFRLRDLLLTPEFRKQVSGYINTRGWLLREAMTCPSQDLQAQEMWLDTRTYLPNDIIVKMERASMAASIEVRSPLLDYRVFELAVAIPSQGKIESGSGLQEVHHVGKLILKETFKDVLPLKVLFRPKMGFGVPIDAWFRNATGKRMLADMVSHLHWGWGILEPREVAKMIESHCNNPTAPCGSAALGHGLWMLVVLNLWLRKHFG